MELPFVWREGFTDYIAGQLRREAARWFRVHQLPGNPGQWAKTRVEIAAKIRASLGVEVDHGLDLDLRETGAVRMDGYTVKNIYFQGRPGVYITGNLYLPDGPGPFPAVLNVHGHHRQGRLAANVQERGHTLAKSGYVCLAVDAFGAGERATVHGCYEYHGSLLGASLFNVGETLMGAQVADNMRAVDLLRSLACVDASKIGVTGASGGGNQTMWLAALDERVAAAVPVVSVGTFESYVTRNNCVCEVLPDGLTFTEESGVLALVAPRALKVCNCLEDGPTFHPAEMLRSFEEARKVFRALGAGDCLANQVFNRPHGYWPEIREAMLGWFDLHLKGVGRGCPRAEEPHECLPEEKIMVFAPGKRDERVVPIAGYCRARGRELRAAYLGRETIDAANARRELARVLRMGTPLELAVVHEYDAAGGWRRLALETACGRMVPLLIRPPKAGCSEYLLAAAPEDKNNLTDSRMYAEAERSGAGLALFDPLGAGETARHAVEAYHELSRSLLWLGHTHLGEWARDYQLSASFLLKSGGAARVTLGGLREAGLAALYAAALSREPLPVVLENAPLSHAFARRVPVARYRDGGASGEYDRQAPPAFFTMAAFIPGILGWGDISLAAALVGAPVRFIAPVLSDGYAPDEGERADFSREFETARARTGVAGGCVFDWQGG